MFNKIKSAEKIIITPNKNEVGDYTLLFENKYTTYNSFNESKTSMDYCTLDVIFPDNFTKDTIINGCSIIIKFD